MVGVVTRREVMRHPFLVLRCYGWRIFWATLRAGEKETFLDIVNRINPIVSEAKIDREQQTHTTN